MQWGWHRKRVSMKKTFLSVCGLLLSMGISAQTQVDNRLFEEAMARYEEPATKAYIIPQIADLQMLSEEREIFGPYKFKLSKSGILAEGELANAKGRALYRATIEADADIMIGTLFDSYIIEGDDKYVVVELSGYPAKFVNFRPITLQDDMIKMINVCYPAYNSTNY